MIDMILLLGIQQETLREVLMYYSNYSVIAIKTALTKETFLKQVANKYYIKHTTNCPAHQQYSLA